ncbi:tripartite tricarboxylate transporter substrate binding protein [Marispirochaeta sp.]|jgi:tripartite-type tricarboxylate transporter receptor subunit TctC|uniref:tripartite tricarboxylate transporter substrate binding protein n=1 Tax=Marispirochaeta sp. TaxID=2038653 RepID=UPI0029C73B19|nr:tripartite tricarboxylate transporter substrate binding protein [Marispirochaeta sp.]
MRRSKSFLSVLIVLLLVFGVVMTVWSEGAQEGDSEKAWPTRAVTMVVPYGAGGDTDFNTRTFAKYLEKELGVPFAVTNIAGSGGTIASRKVKDSDPDGYTILINHTNMVMTEVSGVVDFGFEDFEMACVGAVNADVLTVAADAPYDTLDELAEYSKDHKLKAAGTVGSLTQMETTLLANAGANLNIIDVGGGANRRAALAGGQIDLIPNAYGSILPFIESGDMKPLALLLNERNPLIPDLPTAKEQGYDIVVPMMYTFFLPKGTPQEVLDTISDAVKKIVTTNPAYAEEIKKAYLQAPFFMNADEGKEEFRKIKDLFTKTFEGMQK